MSVDMALELKPFNVTVVSLWPGFSKTELGQKVVETGVAAKASGISEVLFFLIIIKLTNKFFILFAFMLF